MYDLNDLSIYIYMTFNWLLQLDEVLGSRDLTGQYA